jgi:hypothetical protein
MRTAYWAINQEKKETYMSKNLTRKGLAFGAVVALGTSLFAGAPAQASQALTIAPAAGTGYTVLASDDFTLKVFGNAAYTLGAVDTLRWKITRPSAAATATYTVTNGSTTVTAGTGSTATVDILSQTAEAVSGATQLTINPSITTATSQDYIVQAYIEADAAAGLTSGDSIVSPAVTVKFVDGATILPTVTVDPVAQGVAVTGTVKYTVADFNHAESTLANTEVFFSVNGGTYTDTTFTDGATVTLNTAKDGFEYSSANRTAGATTAGASENIGVKAKTKGTDATVYTDSVAVFSSALAASTALEEESTVALGDNVALVSGEYDVRSGTKSLSYRQDFYKESGMINPVAAGQPVRITVTEVTDTIATGDVIRVNGKALTGTGASTQSAVLNTVTDANGGVTVAIESDSGTAGDKITIAVLAVGSTGPRTETLTFEWVAAALTSFTVSGAQLGADRLTLVRGSSVSINYAIRDQFGKPWTKTGTNYRVKAVAGGSQSLVLDTTAAFSNGLATLTFTDNSTAANASTTVVADIQEQVSSSVGFTNTAGTITNAMETDITTNLNIVSAAQAGATINMDASVNTGGATTFSSATGTASSSLVPLADKTLAALDLRSNSNGTATGNNTANAAKISGTVLNSNGSAAAGVPVVIASAGRWFSTTADGNTYVSKDSITVNTNVAGTYAVWALSQRGGAAAITITSGSVSKTQNVKWAAAAATSATTIAITAPDTSVAGRSVDVVVLLTDKHGAPVQTTTNGVERLSVAITGPGSNTAVAATTDADGKISFKLIFGSNDNGTASVKVTYDADGDATVYAPVVVTKNILVGTAAAPAAATAAIAGSTKRFFVSVSNNTGAKNVVVKVAGRTFATLKGSTAAKKTYVVRAPKGSHKVTVFVGGKLIATKTISVK